MNVRGEVHAYLVHEDYRRLQLEALARGVSLSRCAGECLAEYFALRQEMATAFEAPDQAGTLTPPRVIHVLLAQTEQRLVATLERYGDELVTVRGVHWPRFPRTSSRFRRRRHHGNGEGDMNDDLIPNASRTISRRTLLRRTATVMAGGLLGVPATGIAQQCLPTSPDVLGPFYRAGAPARAKLTDPGEAGEVLVVSGTVYGPDCRTPLPGALLDVWQADQAGHYDIKEPANLTDRTQFRLRGRLLTDAQGHYEIETIVPGRYPIPPGLPGFEQHAGRTRPAHVHFIVMHPLYGPLTTQLYFRGDPYLSQDPWAKPSLAINLESQATGDAKRLLGKFNIVLARP